MIQSSLSVAILVAAVALTGCNLHNAGTVGTTPSDGTWTPTGAPSGAGYRPASLGLMATPVATGAPKIPAALTNCFENVGDRAAQQAALTVTQNFADPGVSSYDTDQSRSAFVTLVTGQADGCAVADVQHRWTVDPSGRVKVENR